MTDLTVDEEESRSPWKRIVAVLCVVGLIFAMVAGGFLALFMGIIASSAGAVGSDGSGCVPTSTTASASWGDATSTRPTPPASTSSKPPASSTGWGSSSTGDVAPAAATAPQSIEIPNGRGGKITLNEKQIAIATRIITVGRDLGVSDKGLKIALMTALQESVLRMYANSSVPESLDYPHDAVGSDHDSVNPFQQRVSGWGTVAELMDLDYSIKAFFGGPTGPNGGSPRGLLDINGWESLAPGVAAQRVQVSAFPDAYDKWEPAAEQLIATLGEGITGGCSGSIEGEIQLPLRSDYNMTSGYGPRSSGVPGASTWHAAIDLQRWPNPCGDPVYSILPGKVTLSSALWLSIEHADGYVVSYLHMYKSQRLVDVGDTVEAGEQIGVVGNVPPSGGCHLDLRINVANNTNPEVAKLILSQNDTRLPRSATLPEHQNFVNPEDFFDLWGVDLCPAGSCQ
jgi:murein DD-endopeptidase MepM/ murein hydrolase activator NlpD